MYSTTGILPATTGNPHTTIWSSSRRRGGPRLLSKRQQFQPPFYANNYIQSRNEKLMFSFYHKSQESSKIYTEMYRRSRLAYAQKRQSDAKRLQSSAKFHEIKSLPGFPLSGNVTLMIEIPNVDHASLISRTEKWCKGESIERIMHETGVMIQFPDQLFDGDDAADYINRVSITGDISDVEKARIRLRSFAPISIVFPLSDMKNSIPLEAVKSIVEQAISQNGTAPSNVEVFVTLPQNTSTETTEKPLCIVRGSISHEAEIIRACNTLHSLLFQPGTPLFFTSSIEIPVVQQPAIVGIPEGFIMRMVSAKTNSLIYFPTLGDRKFGATMFYFNGLVQAVLLARKYVQGLLPVRLSFDVEDGDLAYPTDRANRNIFRRNNNFDVNIRVSKSYFEDDRLFDDDTMRHMVIIESGEHNIANVYAARRGILRPGACTEPVITANDYDFYGEKFKRIIAENNRTIFETSVISGLNHNGNLETSFVHLKDQSVLHSQSLIPSSNYDLHSGMRRPHSAVPLPSLGTQGSVVPTETSFTHSVSQSLALTSSELTNYSPFETVTRMQDMDSADLARLNDAISPDSGAFLDMSRESCNNTNVPSGCSPIPPSCTAISSSLFVPPNNIVDALINEQGCSTVAVAAAMLKNSPPQWFQSSSAAAAVKTCDYFGKMSNILGSNVSKSTAMIDTVPIFSDALLREHNDMRTMFPGGIRFSTRSTLKAAVKNEGLPNFSSAIAEQHAYSPGVNTSNDAIDPSSDVRLSSLLYNCGNTDSPTSGNCRKTNFSRGYRFNGLEHRGDGKDRWSTRGTRDQRCSSDYSNMNQSGGITSFAQRFKTRHSLSKNSCEPPVVASDPTYSSKCPHSFSSFQESLRNAVPTGKNNSFASTSGKENEESMMETESTAKTSRPNIDLLCHCSELSHEAEQLEITTARTCGDEQLEECNGACADISITARTYAEIAKRVDVMHLIATVQKSESETIERNVQNIQVPALTINELEKTDGQPSTSYAEMTKKSVQRSLCERSSGCNTDPSQTRNGRTSDRTSNSTDWSLSNCTDVDEILLHLGCQKYSEAFKMEEIDVDSFLMLSANDIINLGVQDPDERTRILYTIKRLRSSHYAT